MRTAVVVPGHGRRRLGGTGRISATCLALVREAEQVAHETPVEVVVFSGASEAEPMCAAWCGPDVELVAEPTAMVTAENAARSLPILLERDIERAVVVCAPLHLYRARFFFSRLYAPHDVETVFRTAPLRQGPRALVWELGATLVVRRHLRAAHDELQPLGR